MDRNERIDLMLELVGRADDPGAALIQFIARALILSGDPANHWANIHDHVSLLIAQHLDAQKAGAR